MLIAAANSRKLLPRCTAAGFGRWGLLARPFSCLRGDLLVRLRGDLLARLRGVLSGTLERTGVMECGAGSLIGPAMISSASRVSRSEPSLLENMLAATDLISCVGIR